MKITACGTASYAGYIGKYWLERLARVPVELDVASEFRYREAPLRPEWAGDIVRDRYEVELIEGFLAAGKPVLGICRGCQLINVAFGGSLYQDIVHQNPAARRHVDREAYDQWRHPLALQPGSRLAALYPGQVESLVESRRARASRSDQPPHIRQGRWRVLWVSGQGVFKEM